MSEPQEDQTPELELAPEAETEAEYEEITSEEVDRIVDALDQLIESTTSENIRFHLEEAAASIYHLVYDDEIADSGELDQAA